MSCQWIVPVHHHQVSHQTVALLCEIGDGDDHDDNDDHDHYHHAKCATDDRDCLSGPGLKVRLKFFGAGRHSGAVPFFR